MKADSITLLDGGMGQELLRRWGRQPQPGWSADVLRAAPELVEQLHFDFIAAGSRVITLSGYTLTRERLERLGQQSQFISLQHQAISVAQAARERAYQQWQVPIAIAGCLPPLVASYRPDVSPDYAHCLCSYSEICALQTAAVDLFICETMSSIKEATAAATAALATGKPCWVAFSVRDDDGNYLRSGEKLCTALDAIRALPVAAVLINCSSPEATTGAMHVLKGSGFSYGAYANAFHSVAPLQPGGTVAALRVRAELSPELYTSFALEWVRAGASIVGGCCEINPEHITHLHAALQKEYIGT